MNNDFVNLLVEDIKKLRELEKEYDCLRNDEKTKYDMKNIYRLSEIYRRKSSVNERIKNGIESGVLKIAYSENGVLKSIFGD